MKVLAYPLFSVVLLVVGCKTTQMSSAATTSGSRYTEDLSSLRPKTEVLKDSVIDKSVAAEEKTTEYVEPVYTVNEKLNAVLDSIDQQNLARKFVEGFTIQVYSGRREEALNARRQLSSLMPDISSEVQFTEPIFRVKAGKYYNWLDAQRDFSEIKKHFRSAIIIPDKIAIN